MIFQGTRVPSTTKHLLLYCKTCCVLEMELDPGIIRWVSFSGQKTTEKWTITSNHHWKQKRQQKFENLKGKTNSSLNITYNRREPRTIAQVLCASDKYVSK